jgi:hypothetical protein
MVIFNSYVKLPVVTGQISWPPWPRLKNGRPGVGLRLDRGTQDLRRFELIYLWWTLRWALDPIYIYTHKLYIYVLYVMDIYIYNYVCLHNMCFLFYFCANVIVIDMYLICHIHDVASRQPWKWRPRSDFPELRTPLGKHGLHVSWFVWFNDGKIINSTMFLNVLQFFLVKSTSSWLNPH